MSSSGRNEEQSFICDARRTQIIEATIATLNETGYVRASLAQIAKRAGISTALISYHFNNRMDLINQTVEALLRDNASFVLERTKTGRNCRERLRLFILSSLEYQETYPERFVALVEIVFNARTPDNIPYYKLSDDTDTEPLLLELRTLLRDGQASGEFGEFDVMIMANTIQGAIGEYASPGVVARMDAVSYGAELVKIFDRAVLPLPARQS